MDIRGEGSMGNRTAGQAGRAVLAAFVLWALLGAVPAGAYRLTLNGAATQVFFSPGGGATRAVVKAVGRAREEILVQAYVFTSAPIATALVAAGQRGVRVEAVLDKSQAGRKYTGATFLLNGGVPVYIDAEHAIAHNKVMVIDRKRVVTGSFNFTTAAEKRNAENLLIVKDRRLAALYLRNWEAHRAHSTPYQGPEARPPADPAPAGPALGGTGGEGR
jgi:phosphatidylserine/phosphatidylglycerophosphate/cardiolipin synthase-like enzyme